MAVIKKVVVTWTGQTGLPGYSLFYCDSAVDVTTDLATFFTAVKGAFPSGTSWDIPNAGDELESTTGALVGSWSGGTAATVTSTAGALGYGAGVGAYVRWNTGIIINGRRLKGRTFLTGINASGYDTDGTISPSYRTTFVSAASALAASTKLKIWHRPPHGASSGGLGDVLSSTIPDRVTSLKSRRV